MRGIQRTSPIMQGQDRRCVVLLMAATLAGCASSSTFYAKAPVEAAHSTGPVHAIEVLGGQQSVQVPDGFEADAKAAAAQYAISWQDPSAGLEYGFEIGVARAGQLASAVDPTAGAVDVGVTWWEYYAGLRSTLTDLPEWIRCYSSFGVSVVDPEVQTAEDSALLVNTETSYGAYLRAGIYFPIFTHLRLGLDYRYRFFDGIEFGQLSGLIGLTL